MLLLAAKQTGSTTWSYDSNGHATAIHDVNGTDRTIQVDTTGHILRMQQGSDTVYSLLINDEVIGSSNTKDPGKDSINQSYQSAMALGAGTTNSTYVIRQGDSFAGIAKAVWGDSSLWYLIADANHLQDDSLKVGTVIVIPPRSTSLHNNTGTNKAYNPNDILGDTSPTLAHPASDDEGCGVVGQIIMVAVAVAVSFYTAGLLSGASGGLLSTMSAGASAMTGGTLAAGTTAIGFSGGFLAGAAGSIASQAVGMAMGNVKEFDWKSVAMSGISAGAGSWVGDLARVGTLPAVFQTSATARAMLSSGVSQGIGIVTGQQNSFSWRNVAIAGASAFVGEQVGSFLKEQNLLNLGNGYEYMTNVARATVSGFASGVTASVLRAGRVDVQQVAADAFGNALGSSLAERNSGTELTPGEIRNLDYDDPKLVEMRANSGLDKLRETVSARMAERHEQFVGKLYAQVFADVQQPVKVDVDELIAKLPEINLSQNVPEIRKPLNEEARKWHNSTISDRVTVNSNLITTGKVWFDEKQVMHIKGNIYDDGTGYGKKFVNSLNRGMSGTWKQNNEEYKISTEMQLTDSKNVGYMTKLERLSDNDKSNGQFLGVDRIGLTSRADARTYVHEFSHLMGMPHRPENEQSLMGFWHPSGNEVAKLQFLDAKHLYEAYKPVYERYVIFSNKNGR